MQLRERRAHPHAKLRVQVREWLVEQERLRLAHDRAPHRHPLPLAARELRRPPLEQVGEAEQLRHLLDAPRNLRFRDAARLEPVAHVLADRHVRVERVGLEHHGDVAAARRQVGDVAVADQDLAAGHVLEPGDHPQERRLAAPRRADEHEKLAVGDEEVEVVDGDRPVVEGLAQIAELELGHVSLRSAA